MKKSLEIAAVVCNLLYTILYLNGSKWCYLFGIIGPLLLAILCLKNKLYAEPILQLTYILMAAYGLITVKEVWVENHASWNYHLAFIIPSALIAICSGFLLRKWTEAKLPFHDSVVTVFGITGTWMMVNYIHENWIYFMVINLISVYIYLQRKLFIGAAMFFLYFVMSVDGFFKLEIFYAW